MVDLIGLIFKILEKKGWYESASLDCAEAIVAGLEEAGLVVISVDDPRLQPPQGETE